MITNQIDESAPDNNKTIDSETGVYLVLSSADIGDSIYCFRVKDGDTSFRVDTKFYSKMDEENNLYSVSYEIDGIQIHGGPRRRGYADLIVNLLRVHGDMFRSSERRFGVVEQVDVEVSPRVVEKIASWENGNG